MRVIQIFLPRFTQYGKRVPQSLFLMLARELSQEFGGVTAYLHSPALGLWKKGTALKRDEIVVFEVMVGRANRTHWSRRRRNLERQFGQERIVIRALPYVEL